MSTLRVNTIQNSGGTGSPEINGLARAWVNFNGQGTVAIRAASNVSSITDNGTGDYTVNFTTALADANYVPYGSAVTPAVSEVMLVLGRTTAQTSSSIRIATLQYNGTTPVDQLYVSVAILR